MRKSKSKTKEIRKRVGKKKTVHEIDMEDRLIACAKGEKESIIYVGSLVENTLKGPFGPIIKALTAGRVDMELQAGKEGRLSAERILGRCEMGSTLWHDLETFVHEKDALLRPSEERESDVESSTASDPTPDETFHA